MSEDQQKINDFIAKAKAQGVPDESITMYLNDRRKEFLAKTEKSPTQDWEMKQDAATGKWYKFNKVTGEIQPYTPEGGTGSVLDDIAEATDSGTADEPTNPNNINILFDEQGNVSGNGQKDDRSFLQKAKDLTKKYSSPADFVIGKIIESLTGSESPNAESTMQKAKEESLLNNVNIDNFSEKLKQLGYDPKNPSQLSLSKKSNSF